MKAKEDQILCSKQGNSNLEIKVEYQDCPYDGKDCTDTSSYACPFDNVRVNNQLEMIMHLKNCRSFGRNPIYCCSKRFGHFFKSKEDLDQLETELEGEDDWVREVKVMLGISTVIICIIYSVLYFVEDR